MTTTQSEKLEKATGRSAAPAHKAVAKKSFVGKNAEHIALAGSLVVLSIIFSFLNPRFASVENLQAILAQAGLPLLIGVGATFVILIGSIDLSVEGVMGASGMTFVLMSANSRGTEDYGFWAWPAAVAIGAALGLISGIIYTRVKVPSFVVTLGMWYVGLGIAIILFGTDAIPTFTDNELGTWAAHITLGMPNSFLLALVVAILGAIVLRFTRFGRVTLAVGANEEIAKSNGLRVTRTKIAIFTIAGSLSGLAGIVAVIQLGMGSATVAQGQLFITIPAVVIGGTALGGGKGGVFGTALGVILLTTLNNGLILSGVSPNFQKAVSGAILVVAIIATAWSQRDRLRISK